MNKNGFTLIELLAVIALLGVIGGIAFVSINGINRNIQENMLEKKVAMIEEAAVLYGQDYRGSVINSSKKYNGSSCISIIVSDLIKDAYMDKDNDNTCLTSSSVSGNGCVVDPSNSENYLDKYEVIIYYKNKRIHAKMDLNNNLTCS